VRKLISADPWRAPGGVSVRDFFPMVEMTEGVAVYLNPSPLSTQSHLSSRTNVRDGSHGLTVGAGLKKRILITSPFIDFSRILFPEKRNQFALSISVQHFFLF